MMSAYAVVYAFVIVAVGFAAVTLGLAKVLRPSLPYARKESTYECGIPAVGSTEVKLNIRFHLYALLFVLFDVEVLYVYPWAVTSRELGTLALVEMAIFISILLLGLAFAWRKGALSWE
ncbi:MAG: NADH-quinone oxidoreductase subunit A [Elusimicrobiota bacterium]|nr:NADH-quinone oxidoreductase subunit A [Elusimicrobiota bacterium]